MTRQRATTSGGGPRGIPPAGLGAAPALRELALAFREVLSDPGRFSRFAGMPMVLMLVLSVAVALYCPPFPNTDGGDAGAVEAQVAAWMEDALPLYCLPLLLSVWSLARMQVWWARWIIDGDDGVGFLSPALGARDIAFMGYSGAALAWAGLGSLSLMPLVAAVGWGLRLAGLEVDDPVVDGVVTALSLAFLLCVASVYGRLMVGVVPLALGRRASLTAGWRATRGHTGRVAVMMGAGLLPLLASAVFSHLSDPVEVAASVLVGGVLRVVALAANAVMLARLYSLTLGRNAGGRGAGQRGSTPD